MKSHEKEKLKSEKYDTSFNDYNKIKYRQKIKSKDTRYIHNDTYCEEITLTTQIVPNKY